MNKKEMINKYKEKLKKHLKEVIEIKTSPHEIALGFAIGVFFANFPTFGLEILLIFLILLMFKRISKISLLSAYAVFNPLITYPLGVISYFIGDFILGDAPITLIRFTLFHELIRFTLRYILGSLILATFLAIVSYWVVYFLSKKYQKGEIPIIQKPILI